MDHRTTSPGRYNGSPTRSLRKIDKEATLLDDRYISLYAGYGADTPDSPMTPPSIPSATSHFSRPRSQPNLRSPLSSTSLNGNIRPSWSKSPTSPSSPSRKGAGSVSSSPLSQFAIQLPPLASMSAMEHIDVAIQLHQVNELGKSFHHFRLAAKTDHPLGMLFYGLSLRHGWGCLKNQEQGIQWIERAADATRGELLTQLENCDPSFLLNNESKALLALAMFELGNSYSQGWGTKVDKKSALKAYETAASWGDAYAMQEAGNCYEKGFGGKKDRRKAAHYYRLAAEKGANLPGYSWIHKSKYSELQGHRTKSLWNFWKG